MKGINRFLIVFFLLLVLACNKENAPDFIKSFGEIKTVQRTTTAFKTIYIRDEFDVEIIQDTAHFIELTFGENVLPKISASVENDVLILENKNKFNWVRKLGKRITARVHVVKLNEIEIDGDATVWNKDTFYADTLNFVHSGTNNIKLLLKSEWATFRCSNVGNLTLSGSCGILSGTVEETAFFDGKHFLAQDAYFYHFSLSDSYIKAQQLYGLNLYGKGNLYYLQDALRNFTKIETGKGRALRY